MEDISHNIQNIQKAFDKILSKNLKAPYYLILHPTFDFQLCFLRGFPYYWAEKGTRFSLTEREFAEDLALQAEGILVLVCEEPTLS